MIKFAIRIWSLVKKALKMQIKDDFNGHFSWVSDIIQIMNENNIKEMTISNSDISHKLKDKFKSDLLESIKSYGEGKKLRTYALYRLYKQVIKYEPYQSSIKKILKIELC